MSTDQKVKADQSSQATVDQEKEQQPQQDDVTNNIDDTQETKTSSDRLARQKWKQKLQEILSSITRNVQKIKQKLGKRIQQKPRRRIFPIWLRIVVVLVLSAIALVVGLLVGYGITEDNPTEILQWETWQHIIDIVVKEE